MTVDLGGNGLDCNPSFDGDGNSLPSDDGKDPWYDPVTGYGPTSMRLDYTRLRFDGLFPQIYADPGRRCPPAQLAGAVILDGRANGVLDFNPAMPGCLDDDGDGVIETTEDFRLGPLVAFDGSCAARLYFSLQVSRELLDRRVFGASWPSWIATPPQADLFWDLRDAMRHWDGLAARFPGFRGMTVFTRLDHVESQNYHPHVRQFLDGMTSRGLWYRLNADAVYVADVAGSLPFGYVETPANAAVLPGQMKARGEPVGTNNETLMAAAHAEMADRVHAGCWWADLAGPLRQAAAPAPEAGDLAFGGDGATLTWSAAGGAFCYDVLRGDVAGLAGAGGSVLLGMAACLEEDSPDTRSLDPASPPVGRAFYDLVRPNGLHGGFGAGSGGRPRLDLGGACDG